MNEFVDKYSSIVLRQGKNNLFFCHPLINGYLHI